MDHKKTKAKPVVAHPEKEKKKLAKMMKKMDLTGASKQKKEKKGGNVADSSESDESNADNEEQQMEDVVKFTKIIKKVKPPSRSHYKDLKKNLRRKIKDGRLPDVAKLDEMLAKAREEASMRDC